MGKHIILCVVVPGKNVIGIQSEPAQQMQHNYTHVSDDPGWPLYILWCRCSFASELLRLSLSNAVVCKDCLCASLLPSLSRGQQALHLEDVLSGQLAEAERPRLVIMLSFLVQPFATYIARTLWGSELHLLSVRVPVLSDARISIPDISSSADSLRSDSKAVNGLKSQSPIALRISLLSTHNQTMQLE